MEYTERGKAMKRTPLKRKTPLKSNTRLKTISKKRLKIMPEYNKLIVKLRYLCNNTSELDGAYADWQSDFLIEPHHINGRAGKLLTNPFNIIMLNRTQHDIEEGKIKGEKHTKGELYAIVREIRIRQGFKEEDYK